MSSSDTDWIAYLAALAIGIALIIWGLIIIGILWFTVSSVIAAHRYKKYLAEAVEEYQAVEDEVAPEMDVDEVFSAAFGVGIDLSENGYDSGFDWLNGTVFGVELEETP